MESILYNTEKKEVVIIFGYGIGNHLSVNYLKEIVADILKIFSAVENADDLTFLQVAESSRRHRYMWYTRIPYDLSKEPMDAHGNIKLSDGRNSVFCVTSHAKGVDGWTHEDETAESIMNRLIHD